MLLSYRSVHSVQHILADRLQLASQPFGLLFTFAHELAVSGLAGIVRKAQKVEGRRAASPGSCSALDGEPSELDQPSLALVDRQAELLQPVSTVPRGAASHPLLADSRSPDRLHIDRR